ncbi:MAG: hypothetical protein K0Q51_1579 [Rickettsiaceae bacterium]|nr:hypothetical protein [Rickettsiaceae bacterium]
MLNKAFELDFCNYRIVSKLFWKYYKWEKPDIFCDKIFISCRTFTIVGILELQLENYSAALEAFEAALEDYGKNKHKYNIDFTFSLTFNKILCLVNYKDTQKALVELYKLQILVNEYYEADYWYIIGEVMLGLNQKQSALLCFRKSVELDQNYFEAIEGIAGLYLSADMILEAKQCFMKLKASNVFTDDYEYIDKQLSIIETEEFIKEQKLQKSKLKSLTDEHEEALSRIICIDVMDEKRWLQSNLPKEIVYNNASVLNMLDYGYKLLDPEGIIPTPPLLGFFSNMLSKENRILSLKLADKDLKPSHPFFSKIGIIIKKLGYLEKAINEGKVSEETKHAALKRLNKLNEYFSKYIEQVIVEYGDSYKKGFWDINDYIVKLSDLAEAKNPLTLSDKTKVYIESDIGEGVSGNLTDIAAKALPPHKPKAKQVYGKHAVVSHDSIHYKYKPYAPGIEFAVNSLHNLIVSGLTPPAKLIKVIRTGIDDGTKNKQEYTLEQSAIYLASKTIDGRNLQEVIDHPKQYLSKLNMENYSGFVIASLLTCPGDAKPDNFITTFELNGNKEVESIKIVGIDNDISFCLGGLGIKKLSGKQHIFSDLLNVLYFLPQMDDMVDSKVRAKLTENNYTAEKISIAWLEQLYQQNERYLKLKESGFEDHDLKELKLPIKFRPGTVKEIYRKLVDITLLLKENEYITHHNLFQKFYPGVSYFYEQIRSKSKGEFESIKKLYAAAADSEELAQKLESNSKVESSKAWNTISTSRMLDAKKFSELFSTDVVHEAESFISSIDFSRFTKQDEAIFAIIRKSLGFVKHLELHNITINQLSLLLDEVNLGFSSWQSVKLHGDKINLEEVNVLRGNVAYKNVAFDLVEKQESTAKQDIVEEKDYIVNLHGLIKAKVNINEQDKDGNTQLHHAAIKGELGKVRTLLDFGIDESIINKAGKKAIDIAEAEGFVEVYQHIAEHKPKIFWKLLKQEDAYKEAAQLVKTMSVKKLEMLVEGELVGADRDILEIVFSNGKASEVAMEVIKKVSTFGKYYGQSKDSALHLAVKHYNDNHVDLIELLIKENVSLLEEYNKIGKSAGDIAQGSQKYNFLSIILNMGGSLSKPANQNEEIIFIAAKYGIKVESKDFKEGYNYKKFDKEGNSLLMLACKNKNYELYQKIKNHYSEELRDLYNDKGYSKLACDNIVKELSKVYKRVKWDITEEEAIIGKININKVNALGNTLLYETIKTLCNTDEDIEEKGKAIKLIIKSGADVDFTGRNNKWTPLHLAVSSGQKEYVEYLLKKGANPYKKDRHGKLPLSLAVHSHNEEMKEILFNYMRVDITKLDSVIKDLDCIGDQETSDCINGRFINFQKEKIPQEASHNTSQKNVLDISSIAKNYKPLPGSESRVNNANAVEAKSKFEEEDTISNYYIKPGKVEVEAIGLNQEISSNDQV